MYLLVLQVKRPVLEALSTSLTEERALLASLATARCVLAVLTRRPSDQFVRENVQIFPFSGHRQPIRWFFLNQQSIEHAVTPDGKAEWDHYSTVVPYREQVWAQTTRSKVSTGQSLILTTELKNACKSVNPTRRSVAAMNGSLLLDTYWCATGVERLTQTPPLCVMDIARPCYFDGRTYQAGETVIIRPCLASMRCVGDNNYDDMKQLGGVCPDEKRDVDGQTGCLFDGRVYAPGESFIVQPCLAKLTCLGHNEYNSQPLGGQCPDGTVKRDVDGQTGCLFDGRVYAKNDKIIIQPCLAEMTCLGSNEYSEPKQL
ncbi:hypothetical protein BaRGS_00006616 [Batillaria attramentaria]|uniref:Uncharacterized protein n=1 Tax=Batillaria attramentaria TaxID=370345 RepID=A0ABD0LSB5_9CAEN